MSQPARIMVFRVTRCPSCESTFNTSPRLLEVAAGRVRCGACLAVFEAAEHFTAEPDEHEEQGSVFVSGLPHEYFDPSDFLTRLEPRDALSPQDDFEPPAPSTARQDFLDTVAGRPDEGPASFELSAESDSGTDGDATPEEPSIEAIRARVLQSDLQDEEALERLPSENLSILERFSTPVELIVARQRAWRRKIVWSVVALLAGLALLGQYLWQERAAYSQVATLRPLYQTACQWLGCSLPVYTNIDAIRSETLAVRSHPRIANVLQANITFRNTAPFPQPFPILILSFNSASNTVIALREFAPAEYLQEGLRDIEIMPVGSPVQVDLELIDPGRDAVNYTMAFRRP